MRFARTSLARTAKVATDFETSLAENGIVRASEDLFASLGTDVSNGARAKVPRRGALLVVANHPGLLDTLALAVALKRDDLRIVARQHPLWKAAPNLTERMILLPEKGRVPASAIRSMIDHLESDAALLIYPSGKIDPDPIVFGVGGSSPASWSPLIVTLARHVGMATIVPAVVYGVFSRRAYRHPVVWLHRNAERRHWLAATLQFLGGARPPSVTHVLFGTAYSFRRADAKSSLGGLDARVRSGFQTLLDRVPTRRDLRNGS